MFPFFKIVKILLLMLVVIYISVCAYLYLNQKSFLYFPWIETEEARIQLLKNSKISEIKLDKDNTFLVGYYLNNNSDVLVIYFGGNGENVVYAAREFIDNDFDYDVLLYNYPHFGQSKGELSEQNLFLTSQNVIEQAASKFPNKKIVLMGRSLGSGLASYNSKNTNIDKIILITPYYSILGLARDALPFLPVSFLFTEKFESYKYLDHKVPTLVIYATGDKVVTNKSTFELIKTANPKSVVVEIKETDHNNISTTKEYWDAVITFLK